VNSCLPAESLAKAGIVDLTRSGKFATNQQFNYSTNQQERACMLKRILIIGLFTGAGQLYSIFVLKLLSSSDAISPSVEIAQLDSLFFFMLSIIAFGLQPSAIRDLALSKEWKQEYRQIQSARIMLGILLTVAVIGAALNKYYLIFLLAPIIACSGEYALYARGAPIFGSFISFLRLTIPFSGALIAAYFFPSYTGLVYALSLMVIYVITNILISRYLGLPLLSKPSIGGLKLYVATLPLGLVTISQYMIGLGLLLVAPYFYQDEILGIAFAGLKFYVLYKGVLRIIHQAFIPDMTKESVCLKVDQLSIMIGFLFLLSTLFFPSSFIRFFFGELALSEKLFFQLLGIAAIICSFYLSMSTTALLQKKDRIYALLTAVAALITILATIGLSFNLPTATSLGVSLCLGEFMMMGGLVWMASGEKRIGKRLLFLAEISFLFLIPFLASYFLGDEFVYYLASLAMVGLILLFLHHKKFQL
jgi:O-antigen/teichoic acid export membrane protein